MRGRILERLTAKACYAQELAEFLKENPKVMQFHLNVLEKNGLIRFEYGLSDDPKPVAVKRARLTDKGGEAIKMIRNIREQFEILAVPRDESKAPKSVQDAVHRWVS